MGYIVEVEGGFSIYGEVCLLFVMLASDRYTFHFFSLIVTWQGNWSFFKS